MSEGKPEQEHVTEAVLSPTIQHVETVPPFEGDTGQGLVLHTNMGDINAILHHGNACSANTAVLWASGARGGYSGPAGGIFAHLAEEFVPCRVTSLRLNYRDPGEFTQSVLDVRCGIEYLASQGCSKVVLVGHSFGGAVVIFAAIDNPKVSAVVSLSPQTYGAQGAPAVSPRPLLLVHGMEDTRRSSSCAKQIYQWANEPKELVLYPGAEHGLRECSEELHQLLRDWIPDKLQISRPT